MTSVIMTSIYPQIVSILTKYPVESISDSELLETMKQFAALYSDVNTAAVGGAIALACLKDARLDPSIESVRARMHQFIRMSMQRGGPLNDAGFMTCHELFTVRMLMYFSTFGKCEHTTQYIAAYGNKC